MYSNKVCCFDTLVGLPITKCSAKNFQTCFEDGTGTNSAFQTIPVGHSQNGQRIDIDFDAFQLISQAFPSVCQDKKVMP